MGLFKKRKSPASDDADGDQGRLFLLDTIQEYLHREQARGTDGIALLGYTANGHQVYTFKPSKAPALFCWTAKAREDSCEAFGWKDPDGTVIDHYDLQPESREAVIIDPDKKEIVGGFRYEPFNHAARTTDGELDLESATLFTFSERFLKDYAPHTLEVTQPFINPCYRGAPEKAVAAKKDIWAGLSGVAKSEKDASYLLGSFLLHPDEQPHARQLLYGFLQHYFSPNGESGLLVPKRTRAWEKNGLDTILREDLDVDANRELVEKEVEERYGEKIPPFFRSYTQVADGMKAFGPALNDHYGDTEGAPELEETLLLIPVEGMHMKVHDQFYKL
ncbi:hypothetical protein KY327_02205 [Candidatus Woesearchaeota archaeon]|nr:hypothetical protein [Candidatus Woesearchaeota archaeon]